MKKMRMKSLLRTVLTLGLLAALLLSLTACGGDKDSDKKKKETEPTIQETQPTQTNPTVKPTKPTQPAQPSQPVSGECLHLDPQWVVEREATCKAEGSRYQECPDCKTKWPAESIAKIGHIASDWITEREATCAQEGVMYSECTMCKQRLASAPLQKLDHAPGQWVIDLEPTATNPGQTHLECSGCQMSLDVMEIPATGSLGLKIEKNPGENTYTVVSIGTCKDNQIFIPRFYEEGVITAIGARAFANCTNVEKIVLPDSVVSIGDRAFYNSGLKEFVIPASVKTMGTQIFFQAKNLDTVYYDSDFASQTTAIFGATSVKKVVFRGAKVPAYVCQDAAELKEIVISNSVREIGTRAFENCYSLLKADIPSSVAVIGDGAFKNCTGLTAVTIPDSISAIGAEVFEGCASLTAVTVPDSVIRIGNRAFAGCKKLAKITLPASITNIGQEAFADCAALQTVAFQGQQAQWDRIPKGTNWDKNTGNYSVVAKS